MGACCSGGSNAGRPVPAELQAATRKFFQLGELPVTLTASAKGQALFIKVAGLDHDYLLLALEAGFHERCYWIREASIHINRGLFLGNFELMLRKSSDEEEAAIARQRSHDGLSASKGDVKVVPLADKGESQLKAMASRKHSPSKQYAAATCQGDEQEEVVRDLNMMCASTLAANDLDLPKLEAAVNAQGGRGGSDLLASEDDKIASATRRQLAKADERAAAQGAVVRLAVVREWAPGLRYAIEQTIQDSGMRIAMARFTISSTAARRTVKDTFWLAVRPDDTDGASWTGSRRRQNTPGSDLPQRRFSNSSLPKRNISTNSPWPSSFASESYWLGADAQGRLARLSEAVAGARPQLSSPTKAYASEEDGMDDFVRQESGGNPLEEYPKALRSKVADLQYRVSTAPDWGLQFDGISKYTGCGMSVAHSGQHVLEFATFYLQSDQERSDAKQGTLGSFAALTGMHKQQSVAEFITEYHPDSRCLTIFKVFLNDVLPAGKRAGARATAEQLPLMQVPAGVKWDGVAALRKLRLIHLCDVVNWNTYCLMSKVGKSGTSGMEQWLLAEEAKASGLTVGDVQSKSAVDVFAKTALGRLVIGVIKIWKEEHSIEHKIQGVSIEYNNSEQEMIYGEYRRVMDIYVQLEGQPAAPAPALVDAMVMEPACAGHRASIGHGARESPSI